MKYIREVSDVHVNVDINRAQSSRVAVLNDMEHCWLPEPMEGDDDTAFVLAGDLWSERKFLTRRYLDGESWLQKVAQRFKYLVFVLGNHDYWKTNVLYEPQEVRRELAAQGITNAHFLEKNFVVLDQVKFVGGTLWTDYNRHDPRIMHIAPSIMNDYRYMRWGGTGPEGYGKCWPKHLYEVHENTKTVIFKNAKRDTADQKVVVVTHMAPSERSVHAYYKHDTDTNFLYFSNIEQRIKQEGQDIDIWFHGHMHAPSDYVLDPHCRVICNPRGYDGYEETGYNPKLRLEVSSL